MLLLTTISFLFALSYNDKLIWILIIELGDNVNLAIEEGEILGLLGPNGAGKTTTLDEGNQMVKDGEIEALIYLKDDFSKSLNQGEKNRDI